MSSSSFAKGLAVLEVFGGSVQSLSLADIARRTGQDRATARRGALTLEKMGYLQRQGRNLALSPKVLTLAGNFLQSNAIHIQIQPLLNDLAARLDSDVWLAMLFQNQVLTLAHSTLHDSTSCHQPVLGQIDAPLQTSLGRMLYAQLPPKDCEAALHTAQLIQHTDNTLVDRALVMDQIRKASETGLCVEDQELELGFAGLAVPVATPTELPVALGIRQAIRPGFSNTRDDLLDSLTSGARKLAQSTAMAAL